MGAHYLSDSDVAELRQMMAAWRGKVALPRASLFPDVEDLMMTPEVFVARTPGTTGIPAMRAGTDDETGTGTGTRLLDQPGYADDVQIYRVLELESEELPSLVKVDGLTRRVYNLTSAALDPDKLILVIRDKFGRWFASVGGAGGSDCTITFVSGICRA